MKPAIGARTEDRLGLRYWFERRGSLFGREHSGTLSLFRFLYCLLVAWEVASAAHANDGDYLRGRAYDPVPLFDSISHDPIPLGAFRIVRWILIVALLAAALGVFTRPALWVSFLGFVVYEGTALGFTKSPNSDYVYHMSNLTVFALAILAIAKGVDRHGIESLIRDRNHAESIPEWPRKTILGLMALAYFGAFYCRMVTDPRWLDGYTIQGYLFDRALRHDVPLAFEVAQSYTACLVFGITTSLFEATFFLVLFFPRLGWIYAIGGLALHASIRELMAIDFFEFFILNYLAMVEWEPLGRRLLGLGAVGASAPLPSRFVPIPIGQRILCIGLLVMQAGCIVARVEHWPFSDFRVYSKRRHPDDVLAPVLGRPTATAEPELLPKRARRVLRSVTDQGRVRSLAKQILDEPDGDPMSEVIKLRNSCLRGIARIRPSLLDSPRGLALYAKRPRFDDTTGRWEIVVVHVCDLVKPDPLRKSAPKPTDGDDGEMLVDDLNDLNDLDDSFEGDPLDGDSSDDGR